MGIFEKDRGCASTRDTGIEPLDPFIVRMVLVVAKLLNP